MSESIALKLDDVKIQLARGSTPIEVYELYTKSLVEKGIPTEGIQLLQAEARDAIQVAWKEVRKRCIFVRLKKSLEKKKEEEGK